MTVTVNGAASGGDAVGDTLSAIENLTGSSFSDLLIGDALANRLDGSDGDDVLRGGDGGDVLIGGGGVDTADFSDLVANTFPFRPVLFSFAGIADAPSASSAGVDADLTRGTAVFYDPGAGSIGIVANPTAAAQPQTTDTLTSIENLTGTVYGDRLAGDGANNVLRGGGGADTLIGGGGTDTASYEGSASAVTVTANGAGNTGGDAQGDALSGMENLLGSSLNDTLTGDVGVNRLDGGAGDDVLRGGAGGDALVGGGNDAFGDTASYAGSSAGVAVTVNGAASGGDASGDTLTGIENLLGSDLVDTLSGDAGANRLDGAAGNDVLNGANGDDTLIGGGGDDRLAGGPGADTLDGGVGVDTIVYSDAAVSVDLTTGRATQGGEADQLIGIENAIGSGANDSFRGDGGANRFIGGGGLDVFNGEGGDDVLLGANLRDEMRGGAGNDLLEGGDGQDVLAGGDGDDVLLGGAGDDQMAGEDGFNYLDGGAGNDNLVGGRDRETLNGGDGDDHIFGWRGQDDLIGGAGRDLFIFNVIDDSTTAASDRIYDFDSMEDRIDISGIDANTALAGDQAFILVGAFTGRAGEAMVFNDAASNTSALLLDQDGDGQAEFLLGFSGLAAVGDWLVL